LCDRSGLGRAKLGALDDVLSHIEVFQAVVVSEVGEIDEIN
jgi:hypothetical protein